MNDHDGYLNYDPFAALYDRTRALPPSVVAQVVDQCGRAAKMKKNGLFLDAGVGTGRFGARLTQVYPGRVVGVDISSEMLLRAREKEARLQLVRGDLLRLPFPDRTFRGALLVHILHLIQDWQEVIEEIRRVLVPGGVLLIGAEQGGRSVLVDFYLQQARQRGLSTDSLGAPGISQPLAYLRRRDRRGVIPRIELLTGRGLTWRRRATAAETIEVLESRPYSQMRHIDDDVHRELIDLTRKYAISTFGSVSESEDLEARFLLYSVSTPT